MSPEATGPLGLDPVLLEVLACPCPQHATLTVDESASQLVCDACARRFDVRDGIPVLLLDD